MFSPQLAIFLGSLAITRPTAGLRPTFRSIHRFEEPRKAWPGAMGRLRRPITYVQTCSRRSVSRVLRSLQDLRTLLPSLLKHVCMERGLRPPSDIPPCFVQTESSSFLGVFCLYAKGGFPTPPSNNPPDSRRIEGFALSLRESIASIKRSNCTRLRGSCLTAFGLQLPLRSVASPPLVGHLIAGFASKLATPLIRCPTNGGDAGLWPGALRAQTGLRPGQPSAGWASPTVWGQTRGQGPGARGLCLTRESRKKRSLGGESTFNLPH